MAEDDNGATYSFDICSQCKISCCQDAKPPLTKKRKKMIKEYLKKQNINIGQPFAKENYCYPVVDEHVFCKFFSKDIGKCCVHPVKPETCVSGPITFGINFGTKKIEWFLKKTELCTFAGILFSNKAAFKDHFEVAKKELTQLICQLKANELRAIARIEEPQTFKIGEDELPPLVIKRLGLK